MQGGLRYATADALRRLEHPGVRLALGVILLASGVDDLVETLQGHEGAIGLDVYHGVIVFSIHHVLHPLREVLDGGTRALKASVSERAGP